MKTFFSLLGVLLFSFGCALSPKNSCIERRGALDLGSGSTKALVADVNVCTHQLDQTFLSDATPIAFQESVEKSPTKSMDNDVIEEAHVKYLALINSMKELNVVRIRAVATAAFRKAANGEQAAEKISADAGVPLQILSQKDEAALGVTSALAKTSFPSTTNSPAVWDIGGGSMQLSFPQLFEGQMASVNFKNKVLQDVLGKNPEKVNSPNPLGKHASKALRLAEKWARENFPQELKDTAKDKQWLGIGGVWWHSVRKQVVLENGKITQKSLMKALKKRSLMTDAQIGGAYAATDVTNLALVLGAMKVLNIQSVTPVEASLVEGLVLSSENP